MNISRFAALTEEPLRREPASIDVLGGVLNMGVHPKITWLAANDAVAAQESFAFETAPLKNLNGPAV
jgi:hypothetical protein